MTDQPTIFRKSYAAFLFDMDGTLLSSIAAAERVWSIWASKHGIDVEKFLPTMHGVRAEDTIRKQNLAGIDVAKEVAWVMQAEIDDVDGVVAIDGILELLNALPQDRWSIVTSATKELAAARLAAAGIAMPKHIVTAEDVKRGKPAPDCFLLAAERLGVKASDCLIFEDAPAGIAAAEAAGADVMVITATHGHPMETQHATTGDYVGITISTGDNGQLTVERRVE
ncbi:HAD-IA family hydrolase [Rhizobium sp. LjRoot254]|uniref:HAD-IA family hydrolase n=1 Tax=Rhizobium sp. LjRoot254 TaxID=3342297 RepID=UPI003F50AD13